MNGSAPPAAWVVLVTGAMRLGYAARGAVYALVGVAALRAAASDTRTPPGLLDSLGRLREMPWSQPLLLALAAGLVAYFIWRGLDCMLDLAGHGRGFGWVERAGLLFVALLHLAFAWYAVRLAVDGTGFAAGSGSRMAGAVAGLIGDPLGRGFVMLVGVGTVSFGAYSIRKGLLGKYRLHMRRTEVLLRLGPLLGFGLVARGGVLAIMGGFIVWSGWALDPSAAGGYGNTLERIRGAVFGRALLGIAGTGMVAFSFYCFVEAACRVIPPRPVRRRPVARGVEPAPAVRSGWTTDP